jgi:hypothetical protein
MYYIMILNNICNNSKEYGINTWKYIKCVNISLMFVQISKETSGYIYKLFK